VGITAIDGNPKLSESVLEERNSTNAAGTQQLDVPPGPHNFWIMFYENRGGKEYQAVLPQVVNIDAQPGCEYIFTAERDSERWWRPVVTEWTPGYNITLEHLDLPAERPRADVFVVVPRDLLVEPVKYSPEGIGSGFTGRSHFNSRVYSGLQRALPLVFSRVTASSQLPVLNQIQNPTVILKPRFRRASYTRDFWSAPVGVKMEYTLEISDAKGKRELTVSIDGKADCEIMPADPGFSPKADLLFRQALQRATDEVIINIVRSAYRFACDLPKNR